MANGENPETNLQHRTSNHLADCRWSTRRWRLGLGCWLLVLLAGFSHLDAQVLITEFMAANDSTLKDRDLQYSDWIELYNAGQSPVNLSGWSLTDTATNLTKWQFPATNLVAGGYLVVF